MTTGKAIAVVGIYGLCFASIVTNHLYDANGFSIIATLILIFAK